MGHSGVLLAFNNSFKARRPSRSWPGSRAAIALAFNEPSLFLIDTFALAPPDLIQGVRQVPKDMELVEDYLGFRRMVVGRLPEGLPHIHDGKLDAFGGIRPDLFEEEVH